MNFFKRLIIFRQYIKIVRTYKAELKQEFNLKFDRIFRLYTVINVPDETQIYGPENTPRLTEEFIKNWVGTLDKYLFEIGLKEYVEVQEISKLDNVNFLLVLKYKYLNTLRWANALTLIGIGALLASIAFLIIF